jgi:hypothetical protein
MGGQRRVEGVGLAASTLAPGRGRLDDPVAHLLEHVAEHRAVAAATMA